MSVGGDDGGDVLFTGTREGLRQYLRTMRVVVAPRGSTEGIGWQGLRFNISVQKSDKSKPDPSTLKIWNLNPESRAWCEREDMWVLVFAGYDSDPDPPLIFSGDIDTAESIHEENDWITSIEARDGGKTFDSSEIITAFEGQQTSNQMLKRLAQTMDLELVLHPGVANITFPQGRVMMDAAREEISALVEVAGAEWNIADGQLVVTPVGKPKEGEIYLVDELTGLIGRPEKIKKKKGKSGKSTGIKFKTLLNGRLKPKGLVQLQSQALSGLYKIKSLTHTADSGWDSAYYTEIEAEVA